MNCPQAQRRILESFERRGNKPADPVLKRHLDGCPACRREFAALEETLQALDQPVTPGPPESLRRHFQAMLAREKEETRTRDLSPRPSARRVSRWPKFLVTLGACALLVFGFTLGRLTQPDLAEAHRSTQHELAALRTKMEEQQSQLSTVAKLVGYSLLQQQQSPAHARLNQVSLAAGEEKLTDQALDELIAALTLDPNANVRLRAVEALYPHARSELVRAGIIAALPREQNPLVQLELIDLVAAAQVRGALPVLEQIASDSEANVSVRSAAQLALAHL